MARITVTSGIGLLAVVLIALAGLPPSEANAAPARRYFVRKGGVVCRQISDVLKIERTLNSMRHFGQIRALVAEGRCQIYAARRAIIDIGATKQSTRVDAFQIRTEDRPNELRWALRKDLGEFAR